MATIAAKTAAEIGHAHPRPSFKLPWWHWACIQCTPDLYSAVTRPECRFEGREEKCPYCHEKATFGKGAMFLHTRHGEVCPASGMSRVTAAAFLEARLNGRSVATALRWSFCTSVRSVREEKPLSVQHPLLVELRDRIRGSGFTVRALSSRIGVPENSITKWWGGRDRISPRLGFILASLDVIGHELVLEHRLGSFAVRDQEELHCISKWLRAELEIDGPEMARRLRITESVATRREKNEYRLGFIAAADWVEALGGRFEFRERRVDG